MGRAAPRVVLGGASAGIFPPRGEGPGVEAAPARTAVPPSQPFPVGEGLKWRLVVRDDALAQGDEFGVAHVVLGVIGAPCADNEAVCAVGFEDVIDGRQEREVRLVGGLACLGLCVVIGADQRPIERLAGVEIMRALIADGLVNLEAVVFAGEVEVGKPFAIPLQMRRRFAPQPAQIGGVLDAEGSGDGVAAFVGHESPAEL